MRKHPKVLSAAALLLAGLLTAAPAAGAGGTPGRAGLREQVTSAKTVYVWATYYGWYDNTPPGCATAYSGCAHGNGTYKDPITFASDKHEFPVGTILYYPTLEKYVVMGDDCQECDEDWSGHGPDGGPHFYHLDIWTGGKGGNEFDAINCEDALTQASASGKPLKTPFIEHPPANEPVSSEPIFDAKTGHCFGGAKTSATHGRYENGLAKQCLSIGQKSSGKAPARLTACGSAASENLTFDGAFFVVDKLCLRTEGGKVGSTLDFFTCNGGPDEQWSVNPNGTITWIQYTRCVADSGGAIKLEKCTSSSSEHWGFTTEKA